MDDDLLFDRALAGLDRERLTALAASLRYRAVRVRATGRIVCADWHDLLADLVLLRREQLPSRAMVLRDEISAVLDATERLPERDLARMILDYDLAIADFERHCGGVMLHWWRALLSILRRALTCQRRSLSPVDA